MKVLQLLLCLLSSLGSALVFSPPVKDHTGDTVLDPQFEAKLRSLINTSMECHHIPGMTLAVVKGDKTWTTGFGMEDIAAGKPVDANSKFNIASLTKAFTATLLGILLQEKGYFKPLACFCACKARFVSDLFGNHIVGFPTRRLICRLDWSAKVSSILGPGYEFVDDDRTAELMLRDLLSHRTGLARLDFGLDCGLPKTVPRSSFSKNLKYLPEEFPLRDRYLYNNYMYMLLGHVTEVLGGQFYETLARNKLFQPLGLNDTSFILIPEDVLGHNVARPYIYKDGAFENGSLEIYDFHPIGSDGGILMSADDMLKWMKFNLNMGKTETGRQLIDKKRFAQMHKVTTPVNYRYDLYRPLFPVDDITIGYGYGWSIQEYRGYRKIKHGGGMVSYITQLWLFPDMDIGIFASVNGPGVGIEAGEHLNVILYYIADHLLGLEPWLNETTACTYPNPWANWTTSEAKVETPINVQLDNLTDYEGSYSNPMFSDIIIFANNSSLNFDSNKVHGILHPSSETDRFLFEITEPWEYTNNATENAILTNVTFDRDVGTRHVTNLTLKLEVDLTYTKGVSVFDLD